MSKWKFKSMEDEARRQYRRRKRLEWLWRISRLSAIATFITAGINIFVPPVAGWAAFALAFIAVAADVFVPKDNRTQGQKDLERFQDQAIKVEKRAKKRAKQS